MMYLPDGVTVQPLEQDDPPPLISEEKHMPKPKRIIVATEGERINNYVIVPGALKLPEGVRKDV